MSKRAVRAAAAVLFSMAVLGQPDPREYERVFLEARARLEGLYGVPPALRGAPIRVTVAAVPGELPAEWAGLPSFAAGAAVEEEGRIVVILSRCGRYPFGDGRQTLVHEVSHVALYRALGKRPPRWFDEGLAMRASGEWDLRDEWNAALALRDVARGRWRIAQMEEDFAQGEGAVRRSYALAKGFVRDLFKDDASLRLFLDEARRMGSVDAAFAVTFGMPPDAAFRAWAKNLPWWGEWVVVLSSPGLLWTGVLLLFFAAVAAAYRRRRRKYEALPD
ncbi:MAG: hypothetical protein ACOYXN_12265 [Acidobacteriota bacterium]